MPGRQIPTLRSAGNIEGKGPVARLEHNVSDLVTLPPDKVVMIDHHYGQRAFHHLMPLRSGDSAMVSANAQNLNDVIALVGWGRRHLGVQYVITDGTEKKIPLDIESDSPVVVPYFSAERYEGNTIWGLPHETAAMLKNKVSFADFVLDNHDLTSTVSIDHDVHPTTVLPYSVIEVPEDALSAIDQRLEASREMYEAFAEIDPEAGEYPLGVVVQQSGGDGGYGTVILRQKDDKWQILADKKVQEFDSYGEAQNVLGALLVEAGGQCKLTRYVDLDDSPSVGTYVNYDEVMPLPVTEQFIENGSCVGGSSQNGKFIDSDSPMIKYQDYMQALTEAIVSTAVGDTTESAHVGIDYMIAGAHEQQLLRLMRENPQLMHLYKDEIIEVGIAECNPRMTSLSLSVWPLLLYENRLANRNADDITYADIQAFYGKPLPDGRVGGFAVWDFVHAPDRVSTTQELVKWIEEMNEKLLHDHMFIAPRLPVEHNDQGAITSVVLGMRPNAEPQVHEKFRSIIEGVSRSCDLNVIEQLQR